MQFYNTLTKNKENYTPIHKGIFHMYSCGPTVYGPQHLGNLRSAILWDFLRRSCEYHGYTVRHVINVTDFGHLTSDADDGEDKMVKGLRREGLDITMSGMKELAKKYTEKYLQDRHALNALRPYRLPFASDHIQEQIDLICSLEEKGFTYTTSDGVYFDTQKDPDYGRLSPCVDHNEHNQGRISDNTEKKHFADFALWKSDATMGWESPWGKGFPGWHIECSAMSMKYLGETFDIHTGGIEHIPIHHENEIAQSQNATGKPLAHVWLHNNHLLMNNEKIAKSSGNSVYLDDVIERGLHLLSLRYFFMQAHYRSSQNFTWEALEASNTALVRLYAQMKKLHHDMPWYSRIFGNAHTDYSQEFKERIADDLDMPQALALVWKVLKDTELSPAKKYKTLLEFDRVLGLDLHTAHHTQTETYPLEVLQLLEQRKQARLEKNWERADALRDAFKEHGYEVTDGSHGQELTKI